jgi:hypothetical protein
MSGQRIERSKGYENYGIRKPSRIFRAMGDGMGIIGFSDAGEMILGVHFAGEAGSGRFIEDESFLSAEETGR